MNASPASVANAPTGAGALSPADNPIISALHEMAVTVLSNQLREMFERADDILFDSAEKARAADEQRVYMDTMRSLRIQRERIIGAFQGVFKQALTKVKDSTDTPVEASDMSQWAIEDGDELEERLAVSGMEDKASSHHAIELEELKRRLARLSELSGRLVSEDTMSPARVIRSFQESIRALPLDFPIKLVIYKLFDRVVLSRYSDLLHGANQLLAVNGVEADAAPSVGRPRRESCATAAPLEEARAGEGAGAASLETPGIAPPWAAAIDPSTLAGFGARLPSPHQLRTLGPAAAAAAARWGAPPMLAGSARGDANDALLVQEITNILLSYRDGRRPTPDVEWLSPESVALVARMFDGYYRDSRLPAPAKQVLSRLQLPIMKAALADRQFFSNPQHPARRVLSDLYEMLAGFAEQANGGSDPVPEDVRALIESVAESFDLDPTRIQNTTAPSITDQDAEVFLRDQQTLRDLKGGQQIERVRRVVAHEVRQRLGARELAPPLMRLFVAGFGPVLTIDYVNGGVGGAGWRSTMALLDRTLASLNPPATSTAAKERQAEEEAALVSAITHRLARIGFSEDRTADVIGGLLAHYVHLRDRPVGESLRTPAPVALAAEGKVSPAKELQGLLSILLVPDTWYTLLDTQTQCRHWVRVRNYYPAQNSILFVHYMEPRFVRMRASSLATGLVEGHAAPIDPSEELRAAAGRVGRINFDRTHDPIVWTGIDGKPAG